MQAPTEAGYVFCKSYRHAKTGKVIVHPTGGYFRFPARGTKADKTPKDGGNSQPSS